MAGRGIRELEQLALYDGRPCLGSIVDYGPGGADGTWIAGHEPVFRREVGQVVGLEYRGNGEAFNTGTITIAQEVSFEFTILCRGLGAGGFGRLWEANAFTCAAYVQAGAPAGFVRLAINMGATITRDVVLDGRPCHVIITRDDGNLGRAYSDGVEVGAAAAIGGNVGATTVMIGNRFNAGAYDRSWDGLFFLTRIFGTKLDDDEVARLYEHSRIQLWPGAPKRSGIISPVV